MTDTPNPQDGQGNPNPNLDTTNPQVGDVVNPPATPAAQSSAPIEPVDQATANEWLKQKRAANAEAAGYRKELEAANARLKEIDDKDKTESQLAIERANKAEQEVAAAREELRSERFRHAAKLGGARDELAARAIIYEIDRAVDNDPEANPEAIVAKLRESSPYLFMQSDGTGGNGQVGPGTVATGAGGPPTPTGGNEAATEIKEIQEWLDNNRAKRDNQSLVLKTAYRRRLRELQS